MCSCDHLPSGTCPPNHVEDLPRVQFFVRFESVVDACHDVLENDDLRKAPNASPICLKRQ